MRYQVCGPHPVFGHQPGETFDADIPERQERRLTRAGHIVRVSTCEVCGFEAKNKAGLATHRRTHEEMNDGEASS